MTNGVPKCETCGREYTDLPEGVDSPSPLLQPGDGQTMTTAQRNLQQQNELFAKLTDQLDQLRQQVEQGSAGSQQVVEQLETLRQQLTPRHGLCIDHNCAMCRVQEEAIKEHVLIYVDWKVPGTITRLQQARQQN